MTASSRNRVNLLMALAVDLQWNSKKFLNVNETAFSGREKDSKKDESQLIIHLNSYIHGTLQLLQLFGVQAKSGI